LLSLLRSPEFKANGLGSLVTVTHRDIEQGGFPEELHGKADAVFLDLPKPYKVGVFVLLLIVCLIMQPSSLYFDNGVNGSSAASAYRSRPMCCGCARLL
jgi:hypothetical protein